MRIFVQENLTKFPKLTKKFSDFFTKFLLRPAVYLYHRRMYFLVKFDWLMGRCDDSAEHSNLKRI